MTTHAMTLPGNNRHGPPDCRGTDCSTPDINKVTHGDTVQAWHDTLEQGAAAMDRYLATYNQLEVAHSDSCQFSQLPPSIHVACRQSYSNLEGELELARKAALFG